MSSYRVPEVPEFYLGAGSEGGTTVRVLHRTDIHLHVHDRISRLASLVHQMNEQHPDIVVFTGDFLRWATPLPQAEEVSRMLNLIEAPLGKYAIRGNHDLRGDGKQVPKMLSDGGFEWLNNKAKCITLPDGQPFWICGMDDAEYGLARRGHLLRIQHEPGFKLLLIHEPILARMVPRGAADLILAGHTHGGQIHLPRIERFWMPSFCGQMYHGFYHCNGATVYVSAGLGESGLPIRICCPPEMPIFNIRV